MTSLNSRLLRLSWIAMYLVMVLFFQQAQVWEHYFNQAHWIYLPYNLARIFLLGYLAWLWLYTGKILYPLISTPHSPAWNAAERWLIYSHLGAFGYIVLFLILGYAQAYYTLIALLVTVPILWHSYPTLSYGLRKFPTRFFKTAFLALQAEKAYPRWLSYSLILIILFQGLALLVIKGLMPGLGSNDDWFQYYPFIRDMVERDHGIQPNSWYIYQNFITGNGAGLYVLGVLLSDIFALQLISVYFFVLSLGLLYLWIRPLTPSILWPLLALLFPLSAVEILGFEFYKNHIILNAFLMMAVYVAVKSHTQWRLQALFLSGALLISPLILAFIVPMILTQWLLGRSHPPNNRDSLKLFLICFLVFSLKLGLNYATLGLAELMPFHVFVQWANFEQLQSWLDPFTLRVLQVLLAPIHLSDVEISRIWTIWQTPEALLYPLQAIFYERQFIPAPFYLGLALLGAGLWLKGDIHLQQAPYQAFKSSLLPLGLLGFTFLLMIVTTQFSIYRFSLFRVFFKIIIYLSLFILILKWLQQRYGTQIRYPHVLEWGLITVLALYPILKWKETWQIVGTDLTSFVGTMKVADLYAQAPGFLTGTRPYAAIYERRWGYVQLGWQIQTLLPAESNILALNPVVGFSSLPRNRFQQGYMADFARNPHQHQALLFGTPKAAQAVLQQARLDFIVMDLRLPFWYLAYSPIFRADALRQIFEPVLLDEDFNVAVLTWKTPAVSTTATGQSSVNPRYERFIQRYQQALAASASHFYAAAYTALQQQLPPTVATTPLSLQQIRQLLQSPPLQPLKEQ